MLLEYIVPLLITVCLAAAALLLLRAMGVPADGSVEIIITGDEDVENIENTVAMAKRLGQRYFSNARVYIRGSDSTYVNALCKRYGVLKKQ
ncbi:MAG: hypothetical protein E7408_00675 [Ruminococcaceae bacterium]|nr:hypothetical protein [Oscillospiraceae bacterium]